MTFAIHGLPVARGVAIGRAVLVASSRLDVAHTFIQPAQVEGEIARLSAAREAVMEELQRLLATMPKDAGRAGRCAGSPPAAAARPEHGR
jgi:phosphotransferase system enzyme I (PtsI)